MAEADKKGKFNSIYLELYSSISIPKSLEPENIAAMLKAGVADKRTVAAPDIISEAEKPARQTKKDRFTSVVLPEGIGVTEAPDNTLDADSDDKGTKKNITVTSNRHKTSAAFRTIASLAACAALAFGSAGYMGVFDSDPIITEEPKGGAAFAENYDDLHKTFEKYYVDDGEKKTLDSAIADIEHSYNDGETVTDPNSVVTQPVSDGGTESDQPEQGGEAAQAGTQGEQGNTGEQQGTQEGQAGVQGDQQGVPGGQQDGQQGGQEDQPDDEHPEVEELHGNDLPIPENPAEDHENEVIFGDGFMAERRGNDIRIFNIPKGLVAFTDTVLPMYQPTQDKSLIGFYAYGTKLMAVYSVAGNGSVYPQDPAANGLLDSLYGAQPSVTSSVEVCIYNVINGKAVLESDVLQDGSYIDMVFSDGALYLMTNYNDYRVSPIIGVDDLQSYVPSYTVNGNKMYIEPQNIMIPEYLATTDYTVISGITPAGVNVQAVLGCEGRIILKNNAVYLFGYDSSDGVDVTSAKVFSLSNGQVMYQKYKDIDGIALSGDGISLFGNSIAITSVAKDESGYVTTIAVYDKDLEMISRASFSGVALTSVKRHGDVLYLGTSAKTEAVYAIDLSDPALPVRLPDTKPAEDMTAGLVKFGDGYVTLTKNADSLVLSRLSQDAAGELRIDYQTVICENGISLAVEDNGLMFVSGNTVGVPYGFYDGLDYCYRYALYKAGGQGFELIGEIEAHEADDVFENSKAYLNNGYLYIFSEGRVYCASTAEGLIQTGTANIIQSAYSGHR